MLQKAGRQRPANLPAVVTANGAGNKLQWGVHSCAGVTFPTQQAWARASAWAAAAKREAMNAASKWRPAWAVLASYAPVSARLHLALFYFYGVYYHWAKRATGDTFTRLPLGAACPKRGQSVSPLARFTSSVSPQLCVVNHLLEAIY